MKLLFKKLMIAFLTGTVLALSTGCASGGYKATRWYAKIINKQHIVVRIVLYIFTSVVFGFTLLADFIVFNTMDFWNGRVAQGNFEFKQQDKTYLAQHEVINGRKKSTISVFDKSKKLLQEVVLIETVDNKIELYIDSQLRKQVDNIYEIPRLSVFDQKGNLISTQSLMRIAVL